uniref:Acylglycerol lipase n=1 Tax=Panagrolaimus sp. JU765 TaxID=591449 RepID=A0AC34RI65_9BILA
MGTGVASRFVAEISDRGTPPTGTILESPFSNIHDVAVNHPFSKPFRWLGKYFDKLLVDRWVDSGLVMRSDKAIGRFKCPILILHAADDHIIPLRLGKALADAAKEADRDIKFVEFEENLNLRHKFIHRAPHFVEILTEFFNYCEVPNRSKFRTHRQEEVYIDQ